ncbi:MAG: PSD1 and planctomycete cytochrome C domain-containing protein [Planctomycetaceae bacterium]
MRVHSLSLMILSAGLSLIVVERVDGQESAKPDPAKLEFFEKKVRPLLVNNCYNCHSADNKADGGLRVDDHRGLLQGGGRGKAIKVGSPEESLLIKAVSHTDAKLKMPPNTRLADDQIDILKQWIKDGAVWPALEIPAELHAKRPEYDQLLKEHWSWQPLHKVNPPIVAEDWSRDDIDRFIQATLAEKGLSPVEDADRITLLRRVTFDLTGLPPTPTEIREFLADKSPQALETVVDRLLQSPAFGERWGRHWLDLARFGESTGSARNLPYPHAWRYRDYVIDAFNKNKPYDQFVKEQIAGDLMPAESDQQRNEQLIATGFLAIGVKDVNQRFKVRYNMDNIDEQIDTVSRSILAVTASCARCHDHKFDPITTNEYYSLAGIFHSTDDCAGLRNKMGGGGLDYYEPKLLLVLAASGPVDPKRAARIEAARKAADEAKAQFEALRDSPDGDKPGPGGKPARQVARQNWNRLQAEYAAMTDPAASGQVTMGVRDAAVIGDTEIRIRGEAEKLGPVVPRGFLNVVKLEEQPVIPKDKSGRLELAQWLTDPRNPLTSRVVVNRLWHHLFGAGLVTSVDNFGVTGDKPSHPELLDYLANQFIQDGWSTKRMIRRLVLTRAYGLGSSATEQHLTTDPANRYVWRHSPRRLEAEELRDATLAATGRLDRTRPKGSAAAELKVIELRNNGPESLHLQEVGRASRARSVYLPLLRTLVPASLEVFDFADQGLVTGSRETTTVPTQALYLLNDPFVRRNSLAMAENLLAANDQTDRDRLETAYLATLGRFPSASEIERAQFFLSDYQSLASDLLAREFAAVARREAEQKSAAKAPADASHPANQGSPSKVPNGNGVAGAQQATIQVVNPDDVEQTEATAKVEPIQARDARSAAWAAFVQALIGSGDFRFVR